MASLVVYSLVCLLIGGVSAEVPRQAQSYDLRRYDNAQSHGHVYINGRGQPDVARRQVFTFVEPSKDLLIIEPGRSRLLHFPAGIRRTALSNKDASDIVQVGPDDLLVMGKNLGVTNFTVWPADPLAAPSVVVVRVERKLDRGLQ